MDEMIKEVARMVRDALSGWPETARLCVILVVLAATAWTIMSVFN
ncbi:MAG: hypothetical protein ACRDRR_22540 [Pseudonocardiaceae bacterium]